MNLQLTLLILGIAAIPAGIGVMLRKPLQGVFAGIPVLLYLGFTTREPLVFGVSILLLVVVGLYLGARAGALTLGGVSR